MQDLATPEPVAAETKAEPHTAEAKVEPGAAEANHMAHGNGVVATL